MAEPESDGATQLTTACWNFGQADTDVGALGVPTRTGAEATENGLQPRPFTAATRNVYVTPFVRPLLNVTHLTDCDELCA